MFPINKYIQRVGQLVVISLLTVLVSCQKEIDIDLHQVPPRIVIEGIVKQDSLAKVRVSRTLDFDDSSGYPFLSGATVTIKDDLGVEEVLKQDASGWYVAAQMKGVPERTYYLSVTYDSQEYTSTSTMPPPVLPDSLSMYKMPVMDFAIPMIHFKDPVGEVNQYYRAIVYINGVQNPNVREFAISAEFMDGSMIHQFLSTSVPGDEDPVKQGDELTIEFQCIDEGSYLFFSTVSQVSSSQNNPTTNIKGGALGYFSACTTHSSSIIAHWKE